MLFWYKDGCLYCSWLFVSAPGRSTGTGKRRFPAFQIPRLSVKVLETWKHNTGTTYVRCGGVNGAIWKWRKFSKHCVILLMCSKLDSRVFVQVLIHALNLSSEWHLIINAFRLNKIYLTFRSLLLPVIKIRLLLWSNWDIKHKQHFELSVQQLLIHIQKK